jgi:rhomboid protease GluP
LANCRQCGTKLPLFSFGDVSEYCKGCKSQLIAEAGAQQVGSDQPESRLTLATYVLVAINIAVFIAMTASGISWLDPETEKVLHWGANYGPKTLNGQYWRVITCMFIHFGIIHIAANMLCLWKLGRLAEKLLDGGALIGVYLLTGMGGALLSLSWNPMRVSAGASGAIFGIAGVLIPVLYYGKLNLDPQRVRHLLAYVVRFSLLNLLFGLQGHIDNMAHLGGLVTGLVIGLFLARTFNSAPDERGTVRRNILAASAAVLLVLFVPVATAKQYAVDLGKGVDAFNKKDYGSAIKFLQGYAAARPDDAYAYALLGASFQALSRFDEAVAEYEKGLSINPQYRYIQVNLANIYLFQKKPEKAVPLYQKAMFRKPLDAETMYSLAEALQQTGKLREAETALRSSIDSDSKSAEAHELLSEVLKDQGKMDEARKEHKIAESLKKPPSGSSTAAH